VSGSSASTDRRLFRVQDAQRFMKLPARSSTTLEEGSGMPRICSNLQLSRPTIEPVCSTRTILEA
jgi:hypothetical protein